MGSNAPGREGDSLNDGRDGGAGCGCQRTAVQKVCIQRRGGDLGDQDSLDLALESLIGRLPRKDRGRISLRLLLPVLGLGLQHGWKLGSSRDGRLLQRRQSPLSGASHNAKFVVALGEQKRLLPGWPGGWLLLPPVLKTPRDCGNGRTWRRHYWTTERIYGPSKEPPLRSQELLGVTVEGSQFLGLRWTLELIEQTPWCGLAERGLHVFGMDLPWLEDGEDVAGARLLVFLVRLWMVQFSEGLLQAG
ncbi:hypothetical protein MLD38_035300 [Melastoma candidum]|uniref:Uncharacterized protein n=1 Tax=Melastoma candidum TaxID=119954 RepID=A0ACB9MCL9_9MYRT|nr:hypothetical protein MLD38_035300 [Melastoma candidum]